MVPMLDRVGTVAVGSLMFGRWRRLLAILRRNRRLVGMAAMLGENRLGTGQSQDRGENRIFHACSLRAHGLDPRPGRSRAARSIADCG